ncbi:MAG: 30S ribosomal protein S16 [Minisyncoccia bacterium]
MLVIRYQRIGKKNRPFFRIVVIEKKRAPKSGKAIENLGFYDPIKKISNFKEERIKYWIEKGAQISDSVYNLLINKNIITGTKRKIKIKRKRNQESNKS